MCMCLCVCVCVWVSGGIGPNREAADCGADSNRNCDREGKRFDRSQITEGRNTDPQAEAGEKKKKKTDSCCCSHRMSSRSEASKAGAVPTPKNKSKNFTLSLNECFPTVYFHTPVVGWGEKGEMRTRGVKRCRQGGGVAECHPVIGESAPLVHGARRLNRERELWQKQADAHLHSSFELGAVPVRRNRGKKRVWWENATKSYTAFYPKAKATHRRNQLCLITTRWCNSERLLPPEGLHFLYFQTREMRL